MPVFFFLPPLVIWLFWYVRIVTISRLASTDRDRAFLYVIPVIAMVALLLLLFGEKATTAEIGALLGHPCFVMAHFLVGVGACAVPLVGLSPRQDVAERRNHGAGWAIGGAILGLSLANGAAAGKFLTLRDDSFLPIVVGISGMILFMFSWSVVEWLTGFSEAITVERDGGAALRLAAFLPLLGVSLGLAVASRFANESLKANCLFAGVAGLVVACSLLEAGFAKNRRPVSGPCKRDVLVALAYLGIAGLEIVLLR